MTTPGSLDISREPMAPVTAFLWAGAWLITAVFAIIALAGVGSNLYDLEGRTPALMISFPLLALGFTVMFVVRGVRAVARTREFRETWNGASLQELRRLSRQGPWLPHLILGSTIGALWLVAIPVFINVRPFVQTAFGLSFMALSLVGMLWVTLVRTGIQRRNAQRRSGSRGA